MRGSITRVDRPTPWLARVDLGVDPATGKRRQASKVFARKKEAEAWVAEQLREIERGTAVDASKTTVVGGKVFAIARQQEDGEMAVSFKCSPMAFDILGEQPGLRPAPYLASRGMSWIQRTTDESMDDDALKDYLAESHRQVAAKLPKRVKLEAGL